MNFSSIHKITKLNLDKAAKSLLADESFYNLNHETANPSSLGKGVPYPANAPACSMTLPAGENYVIGTHYSQLTNETYSWHYNSNGVHFISRINGDGVCEVVYYGDCLVLSAEPKHAITDWRAYMWIEKVCHNRHGRQLVWVDGTDTPIGQLDVEASIATNFFTTPFFTRCNDNPCSAIQMCVPEPDGCLIGTFDPITVSDTGITNRLLDKGFKFMYRYVYYDLRMSEWSDRSSLYYQDSKGCFDNSGGFSRCLKFTIPIGNPLVDKIEFAVSEDGGLTWYLYDTIEKYNPYTSPTQKWYERDFAPIVGNQVSNCVIEYTFCNDRERTPIDPLSVSRVINPMPREVQGLVPMKQSLGFYNYLKGSCPIAKSEADKLTFDKVCPDPATSCDTEYVTFKVRAIIYNQLAHTNGFIYRLGGVGGATTADDKTDPAWFGSPNRDVPLSGIPEYELVQDYDQTFTDTTRNFIAYVEGTDYQVELKQFRSTPHFASTKPVGVLPGMDAAETTKRGNDIFHGNFYYQEGELSVPKGTRGFIRLVSHHQTSGSGDNQDTSTQVIGLIDIRQYDGMQFLNPDPTRKEVAFDTCNPGFGEFETFVIQDLFTPFVDEDEIEGDRPQGTAHNGYIKEKNGFPLEGLRIYQQASYKTTTDFNGFYSFTQNQGTETIDIRAEQNCSGDFTSLEQFSSSGVPGGITYVDYEVESEIYKNSFYVNVEVPVVDCNGSPVSGVRVALLGSKYKTTNTAGIAIFKVRNYNTRARLVVATVMDGRNCFSLDCNGNCNPCLPSSPEITILQSCFEFDTTPMVYTLPVPPVNTASITGRVGLKHGGRYSFGWVAEGDCGRMSAVNLPVKPYMDIPRVQESKTLNFCDYSYNGNGITLPSWVKRIKLVRTANLNPYNLQWLVDDFERTADGKIILTIQSLNDYNARFNFKTNAVYKYFEGDRVEFIRNGDGTLFPLSKGILNFLTLSPFNDEILSGVDSADDADFFNQLVIFDEGKLGDLKKGALIEIQSPQRVIAEPAYFEICASIEVDSNGHLASNTGVFSTFDTYLVSRKVGEFASRLFESKSPSDFWGWTSVDDTVSFLDDTGKVHFINRYENERRYGRNITKNSPTIWNYFGDFEKTFDAQEQGDIVAISLKDDKIGLGISENDNFLFEISDQLLRVGANNTIQASTADAFISNPQAKLRGKFGCQYEDIGSIFFGDGFSLYMDAANNAYITHDYRIAKEAGESISTRAPVGEINSSCNSFFRRRVTEKENFNRTHPNPLDKYRYSTGMNKSTGAMYLTTKSLRMSGINNAASVYALPNDTIVYNPDTDVFLGFTSFTPEGYSQLSLSNTTDCAFITYQNSLPYIHPVVASKWNEFFGVACDWMVGVTLNGQAEKAENKIKLPLATEVQSESMFYVARVTTEMSGLRSEIPAIRFKKNENKWNAAFLNDINTRGGLYNGAAIRSYATSVLFIRDNTQNLAYGTIDNNKRTQYSELDSILIKFMLSESSGQTENL